MRSSTPSSLGVIARSGLFSSNKGSWDGTDAAVGEGWDVEVVDLRSLSPFDDATLIKIAYAFEQATKARRPPLGMPALNTDCEPAHNARSAE